MNLPDMNDLILWPDGDICFAYEIRDMLHKSDDYERIPFDTARWNELVAEHEL